MWINTILANSVGDNAATMAAAGCKSQVQVSDSCMLATVGASCLNCRCDPWQNTWAATSGGGWMCANLRPCAFGPWYALEQPVAVSLPPSLPAPPSLLAGPPASSPPSLTCSDLLKAEVARSMGVAAAARRRLQTAATSPAAPPSAISSGEEEAGLRESAEAACVGRAWCGSWEDGWGLAMCSLALALLLCLARIMLERRRKPTFGKRSSSSPMSVLASAAAARAMPPTPPPSPPELEMAASAPDTANPAEVEVEVAEEGAGAVRMAAANVVPAAVPKEYLHALDVARICGSVHVVLGHLHALGALHATYFFGWGFTWVPWFFMLSGYVLTHARLNARDPDKLDSPVTFTAVRIATLFPMYAIGLVVALLIRISTEKPVPNWYEMGLQGLLLQAWVPWVTEQGVIGTAHLWFVSCLPLYWLAFRSIYRLLRRRLASLRAATLLLLLLCVPPWLAYFLPGSNFDANATSWYKRKWGAMDDEKDFFVVFLKHHPLAYFHLFLFGMVLARWRDLLKAVRRGGESPPLAAACAVCCQCGASLGYAGLLMVFMVEDLQPLAHKLSARLSILMPLQALVLLGLSPLPPLPARRGAGATQPPPPFRDPIELGFSAIARLGGTTIGATSYCFYVSQLAVWALWPVADLGNSFVAFFIFLLSLAYILGCLIATPCAKLWAAHARRKWGPLQLLAFPILLAVFLAGMGARHWPGRAAAAATGAASEPWAEWSPGAEAAPPLPASVADPGRYVDLRLNWSFTGLGGFSENASVTNPSLLWLDNGATLVRAARVHEIVGEISQTTWQGAAVTELLTECAPRAATLDYELSTSGPAPAEPQRTEPSTATHLLGCSGMLPCRAQRRGRGLGSPRLGPARGLGPRRVGPRCPRCGHLDAAPPRAPRRRPARRHGRPRGGGCVGPAVREEAAVQREQRHPLPHRCHRRRGMPRRHSKPQSRSSQPHLAWSHRAPPPSSTVLRTRSCCHCLRARCMGATGSPSRATRRRRRSRTPSATTARAPSTRCTSQPKARRRPRASSRPRRESAAQAAAGRGSTRRTGWASRGAASFTLCTRSTRTRSWSRARPTARAPRVTPPRRTRPSRRSLRRRAPARRPREEEDPTTCRPHRRALLIRRHMFRPQPHPCCPAQRRPTRSSCTAPPPRCRGATSTSPSSTPSAWARARAVRTPPSPIPSPPSHPSPSPASRARCRWCAPPRASRTHQPNPECTATCPPRHDRSAGRAPS